MDDTQRIVKCGNLSLHSAGSFFKKRWHSKYLVLYDGSKSGVKRLELFDSEIKFKKQNPAKIIPLVDCVRVVTCQRHKTTYTFEVRTSDQFYLLAGQSFQDMNDWVNCLRLVAFGQSCASSQPVLQQQQQQSHLATNKRQPSNDNVVNTINTNNNDNSKNNNSGEGNVDALMEKRTTSQQVAGAMNRTADLVKSHDQQHATLMSHTPRTVVTAIGGVHHLGRPSSVSTETNNTTLSQSSQQQQQLTTASQAAAAAANALAKTRQRQPSLLGSCKPQPPTDSPFCRTVSADGGSGTLNTGAAALTAIGQMDTLTPTVLGQLISTSKASPSTASSVLVANLAQQQHTLSQQTTTTEQQLPLIQQATLDEEEENMLYCSIEDNPSEHNYRVKVIETELSLRCQLKCYQLTAPTTISQQYEQLGQFNIKSGVYERTSASSCIEQLPLQQQVTFYQLIIGPQELTLLNDYAAAATLKQHAQQQQGLWSWPYQCIRRYGFDKDNCFMFEAGRKCTSGPGQFIVQTPKAYNIYQDVVKFVNELRSLSTSLELTNDKKKSASTTRTSSEELPSKLQSVAAAEASLKIDTRQQQAIITQIPVTWAPINTTIAINVDTMDTRQHFFDTLRQLDSSSVEPAPTSQGCSTTANTIEQPSSNNSTTTTSHEHHASSSDIARHSADSNPKSTKCIATQLIPDETDESGYEQGDDSVDSSASRFKLKSSSGACGSATRKRQANDSMSSSSSTSSGGSPGHSVSRRSNGSVGGATFNGQGPSKRPPLNTNNSKRTTTNQLQVNHNQQLEMQDLTIFRQPSGDFETNLIRDVYSEITKLHATFAVTSGSADDSMSSNSSNEGSAASDNFGPNEQEADECGNDSGLGALDEPMYTNLRLSVRNRAADFEVDRDLEQDEDDGKDQSRQRINQSFNQTKPQQQMYGHQEQYQKRLQHNSYAHNNFDYLSPPRCGPMYPSMLKPIPECGEVGTQSQFQPKSKITPQNHIGKQNDPTLNHGETRNLNNWKENPDLKKSNQRRMPQVSSSVKSKLPTNHFVINDVQYAKISRNTCSKYESCL